MHYHYNPNRKAILIGSPGGGNSQYLKGVPKDLITKRKFLKSDAGGAWLDNEIITLNNPSARELELAIQRHEADYLYTYFTGHGYTTADGERMLCLKDWDISDFALLNYSPRQLVLVDACRNYAGARISVVRLPEPPYFSFEGSPVREIFDDLILNSPGGRLIVHGTRAGEFAYDSENGGYFTQALFQVISRLEDQGEYFPVGIETLLHYVPHVLREQGNSQIPTITYREGNLAVPFCISIPGAILSEIETVQQPAQATTSSNEALIGIGALALLAVAIIASK